MLIRLGADRTDSIDLQLACILAAVAGALNAIAFYTVGFFSANMTGNVSTLSDHIAFAHWGPAAFCLAIVACFILGATAAGLMISRGQRRGDRGIYAKAILTEAVLLAGLDTALLCLPETWRAPATVLGLAFLMGLQNAAATRISDARVRTTHVSGMLTDIGIGIALLLDTAGRRTACENNPENSTENSTENRADIRNRLRLHLTTVLGFLAGGIAGLLLYRAFGVAALWVITAVLAASALPSLWKSRQGAAPPRTVA